MLQRAASNAYSWWWASHVRTKQSKWLEQNLQDMEEKVGSVLSLIQEDGDSFARRAEMYYKKRPELISFVEESFKAYRALAERYDHISTELQNANATIASVFPEQVQFAMEDEDEENSPRFPKKGSDNSKGNIPKVPKLPVKDLKGFLTSAKKMMQPTKKRKGSISIVKSGLTKVEGLQEIDKLQKRILALQTEKEFAKSSYEAGLTKYWEIDNEITEIQDRIFTLEDEFGEGRVIEDDEARRLMATTALNSCKETLAQLHEKQERSVNEAEVEQKRIEDAREQLDSLKNACLGQEPSSAGDQSSVAVGKSEGSEEASGTAKQKTKDMESLKEKIKEQIEVSLGDTLTVTEMAERIDELVNKVINLETAVSSQTALIHRLRTETDELQMQIRILERDKAALIDGKNNLRNKLSKMEEKLHGIQDLNKSIEDQNINLQTHFTEANCNLDGLSKKLNTVKLDEELGEVKSSKEKKKKSKDSKKKTKEVKMEEEQKKPEEVKTEEEQNKPEEVKTQEQKNPEMGKTEEEQKNPEMVKTEEVQHKPEEVKTEEEQNKPEEVKAEEQNKPEVVKEEEEQNKPEVVNAEEEQNKPGVEKVEGSEVTHESEREKPKAEVKSRKVSEGKLKNLDRSEGYKDMLSERPAEMTPVPGLLEIVDDSLVLVEPQKQSEENGGKLDDANGFTNVGEDAKVEEMVDAKMDDSASTSTNGGGFSHETSMLSEKCKDLIAEDKVDEQSSSQTMEAPAKVESKEQERWEEGEPDWKQLFLKGMEDREKVLLTEYTTMLRNYKDTKKKLTEVETKKQDGIFEITLQLRELRNTNAMKDEEIRSLRQKLSLLQAGLAGNDNNTAQDVEPKVISEKSVEDNNDFGMMLMNQSETMSEIEEKFRMNIDELLEENLDFWLRFSTAFHEIQKFENGVKDLVTEVKKLDEKRKQEGSGSSKYSVKSDVRPLYRHLREIQTELTVWVEKSVLLKDELKNRFSSLCEIQEEITTALKASAEDDEFKFTSFQAAKFQGEVLNMKQENNKVADELQAGLDHVTTLQLEVERTVAKLNDEWGLSGTRSRHSGSLQHSESRSRVPLRSFIFGVKAKKQRTSIFSCVHPALHRKYNGLRSGLGSSNRT